MGNVRNVLTPQMLRRTNLVLWTSRRVGKESIAGGEGWRESGLIVDGSRHQKNWRSGKGKESPRRETRGKKQKIITRGHQGKTPMRIPDRTSHSADMLAVRIGPSKPPLRQVMNVEDIILGKKSSRRERLLSLSWTWAGTKKGVGV